MSDYKKDLEDYFCRFTFGQFVTLVLFEIVTLFFVFYLGAKYGSDLVGGRMAARQSTEVQQEVQEDGVLPKGKKSVDDLVGDNGGYSYPDVLSGNSKAIRIKPSGVAAADVEKQVPVSVPSRQVIQDSASDQPAQEIAARNSNDSDVREPIQVQAKPASKPQKGELAPAMAVKKSHQAPTPAQLTAEEIEKEALRNAPTAEPTAPESDPVAVEEVKPAKPEAVPAGITKNIPGKFSLQMGSYPTLEEAQSSQQNWKKKGYSSFITEAEIPGKGTWYRVRLGSFPTKDKAKALLDKIKKQEKKTGIVVSNKA